MGLQYVKTYSGNLIDLRNSAQADMYRTDDIQTVIKMLNALGPGDALTITCSEEARLPLSPIVRREDNQSREGTV